MFNIYGEFDMRAMSGVTDKPLGSRSAIVSSPTQEDGCRKPKFPTVEHKAAAFDAMCAEAEKQRPEVVAHKAVPVVRRPSVPADLSHLSATVKYRRVPVYEWRMRVDGHRDFRQALLDAVPNPEQWPSREPSVWTRVVDEALVTHHLGVAEESDDYATAKQKLNILLAHAQDIGAYFATHMEGHDEKAS